MADTRVLRPAETALALDLISEMDFLRLKTLARLHARGLPPEVSWDDLLQEAFTRGITGARRKPDDVPMVAFLAGVMRSLKSEHWRRVQATAGGAEPLRLDHETNEPGGLELLDPAPGPERALSARQELAAIEALFADDPPALQVLAGLGEGLAAEQIRAATGMTETDYASVRRRIRRTLIREGLTCEPK